MEIVRGFGFERNGGDFWFRQRVWWLILEMEFGFDKNGGGFWFRLR